MILAKDSYIIKTVTYSEYLTKTGLVKSFDHLRAEGLVSLFPA
jgi:hypothetical protein